nr:hypothetical protein HmN_000880700 [Hymenolepis microstoma]
MQPASRLVRCVKPEDNKCFKFETRTEPRLHLFLYWIGETCSNWDERRLKTIILPPNKDTLTIGRMYNDATQFKFDEEEDLTQYQLENSPEISFSSQMGVLPPAGVHATISRCPSNAFMISSTVMNKIFVNYKRIGDCEILKEKDVIIFGCPYEKHVRQGETVEHFKYDLKFKVHICDGKSTCRWHPFPVNPNFDREHDFLTRAKRQFARQLTWINQEIASILYHEQTDPTCIQLLRLMEERRLKRDFAHNLERINNKHIQFLVIDNNTNRDYANVLGIRSSFFRFVNCMIDNAPDVTVRYKFRSGAPLGHGPQSLTESPFNSGQSDLIDNSDQAIQIVLLFVDRSDPFQDWFNHVLKYLDIHHNLIIGIYHESEQNSFDVINDFVGRRDGYRRTFLPKLRCPWRIWGIKQLRDKSLDLQEMHTWFCDIYRRYP